jgi:hypothetical protein
MTSYSGVHIQHGFKAVLRQIIFSVVNFHFLNNNRRKSSRNVLLSAATPFKKLRSLCGAFQRNSLYHFTIYKP